METASFILVVAMNTMKTRYRLIHRGHRGGKFYAVEKATGKRTSLQTTDKDEAARLLAAMNEAGHQPAINLSLARVYLKHSDPLAAVRTWQHVLGHNSKAVHRAYAKRVLMKIPSLELVRDFNASDCLLATYD